MRRPRLGRRATLAVGGLALVATAGFVLAGGGPEERHASPAVLARIAHRNQDAAAEAAARQAADSQASARAVDLKLDENEAGAAADASRRAANRP
ncbi:MAG: hypothetical protein ACXWUN_05585 [Allosphingosinicella sp.]